MCKTGAYLSFGCRLVWAGVRLSSHRLRLWPARPRRGAVAKRTRRHLRQRHLRQHLRQHLRHLLLRWPTRLLPRRARRHLRHPRPHVAGEARQSLGHGIPEKSR